MSYASVDWEDFPSTNTPMNAANLNKMEKGIKDLYSTDWTNATLSSYITGIVKYTQIGNMVIVIFDDMQISSNISHGVVLASGLPASKQYQKVVLNNFDAPGTLVRLAINTSGQIVDHYTTVSSSSNTYYGTLIYLTD
jgi:hypothetical protein